MALDSLFRHCPTTNQTQQVVIVGIDEADYQLTGGFPISDEMLAKVLQKLQQYQPRIIGLDLFRDLPVGEGRAALLTTMQAMPNVVAVEVALNQDSSLNVAPPSGLRPEQIGLADAIVDSDGKLRRVILAARDWEGDLKYSLSLQLARQYLEKENIDFAHGDRSSDPIYFGDRALLKFQPNTGGYINADANGNQALINFCKFQQPHTTLALRDLIDISDGEQSAPSNEALSKILKDKVVIIGTVASSVKDSFITAAVKETLYSQRTIGHAESNQLIYGVEIHANATQQIIDSALGHAAGLRTWPAAVEYLWIVAWGLLGMAISVILQSPWKSIVSLIAAILGLIGLSYIALLLHWWIPLMPTVFVLGSAGLVTAFFDRDIRAELVQRRLAVERTYDAVHNGPLQHLATILRSLDDTTLSKKQLQQQLQTLNIEMRSIFEYMRQDATDNSQRLYLANDNSLDLQQPLPYLLYQVYEYTLSQQLPGFTTVQNFISPNFECLMDHRFPTEQKRGLCLFLQEALMNVGKHAQKATYLDVLCEADGDRYRLQVIDNGEPTTASARVGEGTRQAIALAQLLGGKFQRSPARPQGNLCELVWPKG